MVTSDAISVLRTQVQIAADSGLAIAATTPPLIQPNWKLLATTDAMLPSVDSVTIELRQSPCGSSPAVQFFADELRRQVPSR